jgi:dTDP-4-dehydrorhamnose reductase
MILTPSKNRSITSILVTGSTGFMGGLITRSLQRKYNIIGTSRKKVNDVNISQCDLTKDTDVRKLAKLISPDIIIHAAGTKDIQFCEDNPELASLINTYSVENIAKYFPNTKIIYISSDYVFKGDVGMYKEDDTPNPITVYGETKYQGEIIGKKIASKCFKVIRTSSVFSKNSSFIEFLRSNLENGINIEAFTDSIFSPTYVYDLIDCIELIMKNDFNQDIFHINGNAISRYTFAKLYADVCNFDSDKVLPKKKDDKHLFLYNDLSMSNSHTNSILQHRPISLPKAFKEIQVKP